MSQRLHIHFTFAMRDSESMDELTRRSENHLNLQFTGKLIFGYTCHAFVRKVCCLTFRNFGANGRMLPLATRTLLMTVNLLSRSRIDNFDSLFIAATSITVSVGGYVAVGQAKDSVIKL